VGSRYQQNLGPEDPYEPHMGLKTQVVSIGIQLLGIDWVTAQAVKLPNLQLCAIFVL